MLLNGEIDDTSAHAHLGEGRLIGNRQRGGGAGADRRDSVGQPTTAAGHALGVGPDGPLAPLVDVMEGRLGTGGGLGLEYALGKIQCTPSGGTDGSQRGWRPDPGRIGEAGPVPVAPG